MPLKGYATPEGTQRFKSRFNGNPNVCTEHLRDLINGLTLSSVGMGTYLGNPNSEDDALTMDAVIQSVKDGGFKERLRESCAQSQASLSTGAKVLVGVNKYVNKEESIRVQKDEQERLSKNIEMEHFKGQVAL